MPVSALSCQQWLPDATRKAQGPADLGTQGCKEAGRGPLRLLLPSVGDSSTPSAGMRGRRAAASGGSLGASLT